LFEPFESYGRDQGWRLSDRPSPFSCFTEPQYAPPITWAGVSDPVSGIGMVGIDMNPLQNYREAIYTDLSEIMVLILPIVLVFGIRIQKLMDMMNIKFESNPTFGIDFFALKSTVVLSNSELKDGWTQQNAYYIASGGEDKMAVGYFGSYNFSHESSNLLETIVYYFFDSISVTPCNKDSLFQIELEFPNVFTPNNDGINDEYIVWSQNLESLMVTVLNRWGNIINEFDGLNASWDGKDL
jgi:hypothetical protein